MILPGRLLVVAAVCAAMVGCAQLNLQSGFSAKSLRRGADTYDFLSDEGGPPEDSPPKRVAANEEQSESVVIDSPHDSATQTLIDMELRDAAPAERVKWLEFLSKMPASAIPSALRQRRKGELNLPAVAGTPEEDDGENILAGHDRGSVSEDVSTADAVGGSEAPARKRPYANLLPKFGLSQILPGHEEDDQESEQAPVTIKPLVVDEPEIETEEPITPGASLWQDEVRKLISLLEADISTMDPADGEEQNLFVKRQVALRMLHLLMNDPQQAQRVIPNLPPAEQEFWTSVFWGLSSYLNEESVDSAKRRQDTLNQLRAAVRHLQATAPLELRHLAFCSQIDGFGSYEPFESETFASGQSVLLYGELSGFHSEPNVDGFYETRIRSSVEIVNVDSELVVDQFDFGTTPDVCRVMRNDYFQSFRIDFPQLSSGEYELRLRVQDEQTGKSAIQTLTFAIR
ncbi:MAG: hypothetical protein KDA88_06890 [Planctomycetaceae bacterium]|nr:hypothetical protein [Planctomycetaceae bacterium]